MNNAVHANAPAIILADDDCRKIPGCSTNWVILLAAADIPDPLDNGIIDDNDDDDDVGDCVEDDNISAILI